MAEPKRLLFCQISQKWFCTLYDPPNCILYSVQLFYFVQQTNSTVQCTHNCFTLRSRQIQLYIVHTTILLCMTHPTVHCSVVYSVNTTILVCTTHPTVHCSAVYSVHTTILLCMTHPTVHCSAVYSVNTTILICTTHPTVHCTAVYTVHVQCTVYSVHTTILLCAADKLVSINVDSRKGNAITELIYICLG